MNAVSVFEFYLEDRKWAWDKFWIAVELQNVIVPSKQANICLENVCAAFSISCYPWNDGSDSNLQTNVNGVLFTSACSNSTLSRLFIIIIIVS